MQNVKMTVQGDKLTITVDLAAPGKPSASGKTTVIASTHGNQKLDGRNEYIGLNLYRK